MFPSTVTPSAGPSRTPSSRGWRIGLPVLQGAVVALRELRASDAPALLTAFGSPDVTRLISPPPPTLAGSRSSSRGRSASVKPDSRSLRDHVERHRYGRRPVPGEGPSARVRHRGMGLRAGGEFWGSGIFMDGAELILDFAFDVLGVHRLEARAALGTAAATARCKARRDRRKGSCSVRSSETALPRSGALDDSRGRVGAT